MTTSTISALRAGIIACCVQLALGAVGCAAMPTNADTPDAVVKPAATQRPTLPIDVDDALHGAPDVTYEWWYLDAEFSNGYSMAMMWHIGVPQAGHEATSARLVQFSLYDPQGKKAGVEATFSSNDVSISKTRCDVRMGRHRLSGSYPRWMVDFRNEGLGCTLVFDSMTEGFKTPPDGRTYFSRNPDRYIGWVIAQPRAKVTGTLILEGKEIPVTGEGYHDHNWGNAALADMYHHWYWGRVFLPGRTLVYSVGEMPVALGSKPTSALLTFQGGRLIDVSTRVGTETGDLAQDSRTGTAYPRSLILCPAGYVVNGTLTHKLTQPLEAFAAMGRLPVKGYLRFRSECDIELDIAGEKVSVRKPLLHEFIVP